MAEFKDSDTFVVTGTQLNRRIKVDEEWEPANLARGQEFTVGFKVSDDDPGVTRREVSRWLGMQPRMVALKSDLEAAQVSANEQAATIADLTAQLEQARRDLAAAGAAGATIPNATGTSGGGGPLEQPAGNASADDWRAWVKQEHPDLDPAEVDVTSRDDLRDTYGSTS